jgi:hypothetical protein
MTPKTKERLSDLSRRARLVFDAIRHARNGDPAAADEQMVEINAAWRQVHEETEELLEVYPHLLDALEMRFRRNYRKRPQDCFRVEELIAFACTHQLELNGECSRKSLE